MKKIYTSILLTIFLLTNSCDSVRSALGGSKQNSSDEFLVEKKNPLVLPPDFQSLPEPGDPVEMSREETIEAEIDDILSSIKIEEELNDEFEGTSNNSSTEDFVLDQIKK